MNAVTVGNPSAGNHSSKSISGFTRERCPTYVLSVGRPLTTDPILINTKLLILETGLIKAVIV